MSSSSPTYQCTKQVRVAICVATYRRTELLRELLMALGQLIFHKVPAAEVRIVVVDNDAARSAEGVCNVPDFRWPIRYVCEPQRGIARARNRTLAEAGATEFLAFIDDDETPTTRWLDELLWAQSEFHADVVSGPVVPTYTADIPQWIRTGEFFRRPTFRSGEAVRLCSTNNALIRSALLEKVSGFDEQFNFTGGEDTHFFLKLRQSGCRMVFSQDAIVYEPITRQRANIHWLLRRGFQSGNSWALSERDLDPQPAVTLLRGLKGLAHALRGLAQIVPSLVFSRVAVIRALQEVCLGAGMLTGAAGHRYLPYRNASLSTLQSPETTRSHSCD